VLFTVFVVNILVLLYFLVNRGLVTDFSEPPNLFTLAVNSPPSHHVAGSCGGGPQADEYQVKWGVHMEGEHLYMQSTETEKSKRKSTAAREEGVEMVSPIGRMYSKLSKRKSVL